MRIVTASGTGLGSPGRRRRRGSRRARRSSIARRLAHGSSSRSRRARPRPGRTVDVAAMSWNFRSQKTGSRARSAPTTSGPEALRAEADLGHAEPGRTLGHAQSSHRVVEVERDREVLANLGRSFGQAHFYLRRASAGDSRLDATTRAPRCHGRKEMCAGTAPPRVPGARSQAHAGRRRWRCGPGRADAPARSSSAASAPVVTFDADDGQGRAARRGRRGPRARRWVDRGAHSPRRVARTESVRAGLGIDGDPEQRVHEGDRFRAPPRAAAAIGHELGDVGLSFGQRGRPQKAVAWILARVSSAECAKIRVPLRVWDRRGSPRPRPQRRARRPGARRPLRGRVGATQIDATTRSAVSRAAAGRRASHPSHPDPAGRR